MKRYSLRETEGRAWVCNGRFWKMGNGYNKWWNDSVQDKIREKMTYDQLHYLNEPLYLSRTKQNKDMVSRHAWPPLTVSFVICGGNGFAYLWMWRRQEDDEKDKAQRVTKS